MGEGGRVTDSRVGSGAPVGVGRLTTACRGTGSSPCAVRTQVMGRELLAAAGVPRAGVRLRDWMGSWTGLGAAGRKGGTSGRPCFRDVAGV